MHSYHQELANHASTESNVMFIIILILAIATGWLLTERGNLKDAVKELTKAAEGLQVDFETAATLRDHWFADAKRLRLAMKDARLLLKHGAFPAKQRPEAERLVAMDLGEESG